MELRVRPFFSPGRPAASGARSPTALAERGRQSRPLLAQGRRARAARRGAARESTVWPSPTWPSPAPLCSFSPARERSTCSSPMRGFPAQGSSRSFTQSEAERALRVNLERADAHGPRASARMIERGSGHLVMVASLSGSCRHGAPVHLQRHQVRAARLCARPARGPARDGRGRFPDLARLHPRRGHVRRLGRRAHGHGHRTPARGRRGCGRGDRRRTRRDHRRSLRQTALCEVRRPPPNWRAGSRAAAAARRATKSRGQTEKR